MNETTPTETQPTTGETTAPSPSGESAAPETPDLTTRLVEGFCKALESGAADVYDRWGYSLFHSIQPDVAERERARLGVPLRDALDHFNRGCLLAGDGKFAEAVKAFDQAVKLKEDFYEARYNLGLALERAGEIPKARKAWTESLQHCDDEAEASAIKHHLSELADL